jgi:tetratricopeptide (TPR) repeat protein
MARSRARPVLGIAACALFLALCAWRAGAEALEYRAEDLLWSGQPAGAAAAFARLARVDPLSSDALIGEADARFALGEQADLGAASQIVLLEEAVERYRRALRRAPDSAYAWAQLGRAYAALAVARRAAARLDISSLLAADDLRTEEDRWAAAALRRSVELEPGNYDFINFVAEFLYARGDAEALDWFRRGTRTLPKILLHRYLESPNVPEEVVQAAVAGALESVGTGNVVPDTKILEEVALFLSSRRDFDKAIEVNRRAMQAYEAIGQVKTTAWLWTREGVWLEGVGRREEARTALARALEIDPGRVAALVALGRIEVRDGNLDAAVERYREALAASPDGGFRMELARALEDAGRLEESAREYERAALVEETRVPAAMALVRVYRQQGIYDRAIEHARRLVDLQPDEPAFRQQLEELSERLAF